MNIKNGNLNYDQSGRAYPDNPEIIENWDCIWEHGGKCKYYKIEGYEWTEVSPYDEIVDEAYENYVKKMNDDFIKSDISLPPAYYPVDKEVFIEKIKTDDEFSKTWGLKIEEKILSDGERLWICAQRHHIRFDTNDGLTWYDPDNPDRDKLKWMTESQRQLCDYKNIPTKLITLTYNNETIEVYG